MISRRRFLATSAAATLLPSAARAVGAPLPIFDAHIHFSHDAAELHSVADAVAFMEKAGLKRALISSSGDAGTRALYAAAPDLVLPSLRPYRRRGEISRWVDDPTVIGFPRGPAQAVPLGRGRRIPICSPARRKRPCRGA